MRHITQDKVELNVKDIRTKNQFLIFPKCLKNSKGFWEWRWLENAVIEEIYEGRDSGDPLCEGLCRDYDWYENRWVD